MAFDGLVVRALAQELNNKLVGSRLDKIYQPEPDELLLGFHGPAGTYKVTLSANASIPRIAIADGTKENPMVAPMFCMLLRKHLISAHVLGVRQPGLERMLSFDLETRNELGDKVQKSLIVEIMGRYSNIILLDENGYVTDSLKRIDFSVSSKRQILPSLPYEMPPAQDKINPLTCTLENFTEALSDITETERLDKAVLNRFQGISPLVAREIAYRSWGETDAPCRDMSYGRLLDVATVMGQLFRTLDEVRPCILTDRETGRLMEFSAIPITQYGDSVSLKESDSMGSLVHEFYAERDRKERINRRSANLAKIVSTHIDRCAKKLELQNTELSDTENREQWRQFGELITANIYQIQKGEEQIRVMNYFDEAMPMVVIPLDSTLSPAANAQRYYKKYNKAKTAAEELKKQIALAKEELLYLESVEEALSRAETTAALSEIGDELAAQGYIRRPQESRKKKEAPASPARYETEDGFTLYAGRNNKQNDYLTCKLAQNRDLWFHTKNTPGSHVVLKYEIDRPFTDAAILQVASLAAYLSKATDSENVPVDYTEIRNVKKPAGAKPGFVIYTTNKTVYVTPKNIK